MRWLWISAAVAFVLDQGSKLGVIHGLGLEFGEDMDVWPPFLIFRRGLNTGINFGLFADSAEVVRWILVALALAISVGLMLWARHSFHRPIEFAAAGIAIGGAMGNAIDRVFYPGVVDFLNMSCCGINNPYIFNLADVFIFAGLIGLVLITDGGPKKRKTAKRPAAQRKKGS